MTCPPPETVYHTIYGRPFFNQVRLATGKEPFAGFAGENARIGASVKLFRLAKVSAVASADCTFPRLIKPNIVTSPPAKGSMGSSVPAINIKGGVGPTCAQTLSSASRRL